MSFLDNFEHVKGKVKPFTVCEVITDGRTAGHKYSKGEQIMATGRNYAGFEIFINNHGEYQFLEGSDYKIIKEGVTAH